MYSQLYNPNSKIIVRTTVWFNLSLFLGDKLQV